MQSEIAISKAENSDMEEKRRTYSRKRSSSLVLFAVVPLEEPRRRLSQERKEKLDLKISLKNDHNKGMLNSVLKMGNNFYYLVSGRYHLWAKKSETYLLGERYQPAQKSKFQKDLKSVLWFSYREEFPILACSDPKKYSYSSDRGWGCMIRAGQMMLSEVLKRNIFTISGDYHKTLMEDSLYKICEYFWDTNKTPSETPFSIHNVSEEALQRLKKEPGTWYTSSSITYILSCLIEKYQERLPEMRFKIVLYNEGIIFEDELLDKASMPKKKTRMLESKKSNQSDEESKENEQPRRTLEEAEWNYGVFVVVMCKTGVDRHEKQYLPTISTLLKLRQSVGILSGRGSRAYYVVGLSGNYLLYLDPHYVQKAARKRNDIQYMMSTYLVQTCLTMSLEELSTSVGFGFYFDSKQDYIDFKRNIQLAREADSDFLLGIQEETPKTRESLLKSIIDDEAHTDYLQNPRIDAEFR